MNKHLSLCLVMLLFSVTVFGEEQELVLDATASVDLALEKNLQVKGAQTTMSIRQLTRDNVWNEFLPSVTASGTLAHSNEASSMSAMIPGYSQWNLQASLSLQLSLSWKNVTNIQKTILDYEAGVLGLAKARSIMTRNVLQQFYGLLVTHEQLALARITLSNAEERFRQAVLDYGNGYVSEYDMLKTQVYFENAKPSVLELENTLTNMETLFKMTLGIEWDRKIRLSGTLDVFPAQYDAEELIRSHLGRRFDIMEARASIDSLKNTFDSTMTLFYPTLILGFSMDPTINNPFEKDLFVADNWGQNSGAFSITLRLMLDPLVPNSKTRIALQTLAAQQKLAEDQLVELHKSAQAAIREKVRNLEKSRVSIGIKELNVQVALRAYGLAQEAYNAGGLDLLEVKDTERELLQAKLSLLQEKYTYLRALLDLEYELNMESSMIRTKKEEPSDEQK